MYYERYTRIARNVILKTKRAMPANVSRLHEVAINQDQAFTNIH